MQSQALASAQLGEDTLATSKYGRWYRVGAHVTGKEHTMTQEAEEGLAWSFSNNVLTRTNLNHIRTK